MNRRHQIGVAPALALLMVMIGGAAAMLLADDANPPASTGAIYDPRAIAALHRMIDFGQTLKSYRLDIASSMKVSAQGMNMDQSTTWRVAVRRPDHLAVALTSGMAGATVVTDGATFHAATYGQTGVEYLEEGAPPSLDSLFRRPDWPILEGESSPLPEWLSGGPGGYDSLMSGVMRVEHVGVDSVAGVACDHLRLFQSEQNWDLWIRAGDRPLPMRIVPDLTQAIEAAAEQSPMMKDVKMEAAVEFTDWTLDPSIPDDVFVFTPPAGAKKVTALFGAMGSGPDPVVGEVAPAFELARLDSGTVSLADYAGKDIVILDFWATWCGPCRHSMPEIAGVASDFKGRDVVVYAVNEREDAAKIREFLTRNTLALSVLLDGDGRVGMRYKAKGIPRTVIIGKDGRVKAVHVGYRPDIRKQISDELNTLLAGRDLAPGAEPGAGASSDQPAGGSER